MILCLQMCGNLGATHASKYTAIRSDTSYVILWVIRDSRNVGGALSSIVQDVNVT